MVILLLVASGLLAGCTGLQKPTVLSPLQHGIKALANENYKLAVKLFTEAIERNPNSAVAYFNRGNAYQAQKRYLRAISDYDLAIKRQPRMAQAYQNRGLAKRKLDRIKDAIADYTLAIKYQPGYFQAYNNRGYAFYLIKNYFRAVKDFSQALTLNPRLLIALNNRAVVYMDWGKYQQAVDDYSRIIEHDPSEPGILYQRALAYHHLKKDLLAARDLKKVLTIEPGNKKAAGLLARLKKNGLLKPRPETPPAPGGMTPPTLVAVKKISPATTPPPGTRPGLKPKPGPKPKPKLEPKPGPGPKPRTGPPPGPGPTAPRPPAAVRQTMDIFTAASTGNLAQVQAAVRRQPQAVRQRDQNGSTALHLAAQSGKTDVIRFLVSVGAEVNARDRGGHTPLYWAIKANHAAAAALLARLGGRE